MAQILTKRYRTFIDCHGEQTDITHDYGASTTYHHANDGKEYDTLDQVVTDIVDNNEFNIPAMPKTGEWVEQDDVYVKDGKVYKVRQSHRITIFDPKTTPALFTIFRKEATGDVPNEWIAGEKVDVGMKRIYKKVTYEVIQSHLTQWEPDSTPALWKEVQTGYPVYKPVTGAHDVYMKGDIVWFPDKKGALYISTIDNNSWAPGVHGWKKYTP